jgi:hypothetical protein
LVFGIDGVIGDSLLVIGNSEPVPANHQLPITNHQLPKLIVVLDIGENRTFNKKITTQ